MSIELPEAQILAEQMNKELLGKVVRSFRLENSQKLQRLGFINREMKAFNQFLNGKIESVLSRGNVIRVRFGNGMNLILAPEYGGKITYYMNRKDVPKQFHLMLDFSDGTALTVALSGMGVIQALEDNELERSYVYRRDFSEVASPADTTEFTFERFSKRLSEKHVNIKGVLVGKDAVIVGLSNSVFQDVIFRAKIHPKRKASELSEEQRHNLYDAIRTVIQERIRLGGKNQFLDLYGRQGSYTPAMGSNMNGKTCPVCGTFIEKLSLGGGQTYFCPRCQK